MRGRQGIGNLTCLVVQVKGQIDGKQPPDRAYIWRAIEQATPIVAPVRKLRTEIEILPLPRGKPLSSGYEDLAPICDAMCNARL